MGVAATTTLATAVIFLCFFSTVAKFETFTRSYHTFDKSLESQANSELVFTNNAMVNQEALQVTPDTTSQDEMFHLQFLSGRVMFRKRFRLWDGDATSNTTVASFNTSFLFNIFPVSDNDTPGEGLAFLIAHTIDVPDNSFGPFLGLTNTTLEQSPTNGIVAVEFDTVKQPPVDIDNNHIGLNIHSIKSVVSESLTPLNITLAPLVPAFHNIWIQYNGVEKMIRVYIANQPNKSSPTPPMPETPIISYSLDLKQTVHRESYIGFAASTGTFAQLNCVLRWNITVQHFAEPKSTPWPTIMLAVGIPLVLSLAALIGCLGYMLYKKRLVDRSKSNILRRVRTLPWMPKEFRFRELKKATNNFDDKRKLGQGGFGVVYRGVLPEDGVEVAVKWFSRESLKGEDDFLAELTIINRLRHKHLVRLLGWCHKNGKLLLVYEYMQNGSLDIHLFTMTREPLSWTLRSKILTGVGSALHYLHYEYNQKVVHRDIKASNIMLDSNFNACLGDFGLARALDNERKSYAEAEGVLGTIGYIAPECFHTGKATQQSDIYAFGALLIEVVSGQRPGTKVNGFQFMVDYVWSLYREGRILDAVDKRLVDSYDTEEVQRFLLLGLACSHPIASERPETHTIVQMLAGSVAVPQVPPFKPAFMWRAAMPVDYLSQATSIEAFN